MKTYKLSIQFYIIFVLISVLPAMYISSLLKTFFEIYFIQHLPQNILVINLPLFLEAPATIAIIGLLFVWYENYLWRVKPFRYIHNMPNINGRYKGELISNYDTNRKFSIIFEIEQTLTSVDLMTYTEIESSYTLISSLGKNTHNRWSIINVYQAVIDPMKAREELKNHEGVAYTDIHQNGNMLKGSYFSNPRNRGHYGTYELIREGKNLLGRF